MFVFQSKLPLLTLIFLVQWASCKVVQFELNLTWEEKEVAGFTRKAIATNGQIPGPALRIQQGDDVEVLVNNSMPFGTTIHFHGRSFLLLFCPSQINAYQFQVLNSVVPPGPTAYLVCRSTRSRRATNSSIDGRPNSMGSTCTMRTREARQTTAAMEPCIFSPTSPSRGRLG